MGNSKKSKALIFIIIAAILLLAFSGTGGGKKEEKSIAKDGDDNEIFVEQYIAESEKRLEEILSTVQGAGRVSVMITVEDVGEKVLAENEKTENDRENDGEKSSSSQNKEQTAIIYGSGSDEKPFVLKEKLPLPSGVLVVATGAGDESVRLEIYEAVKALYGISGHRIKVTKGNLK
jgi:stage III sporulation protein AG